MPPSLTIQATLTVMIDNFIITAIINIIMIVFYEYEKYTLNSFCIALFTFGENRSFPIQCRLLFQCFLYQYFAQLASDLCWSDTF